MRITTPQHRHRQARSFEGGVAAIEFAILSPLLAVVLIALVELGFASYQAMQVQSAAEAGTIYAAEHGWNLAAIQAAVVNATGAVGVTAVPAPITFCGCPTTTGIVTTSCSLKCTGGTTPGQYVQVYASVTHTMILPYPGLPSPLVLQGKSTIRFN